MLEDIPIFHFEDIVHLVAKDYAIKELLSIQRNSYYGGRFLTKEQIVKSFNDAYLFMRTKIINSTTE